MSFKTNIAKVCAHGSRFILKNILRRDAAFFPGNLAMKIDSNILRDCTKFFDKGTVLVTGTNGKTSVTSLIAHCMAYYGYNVAWNNTGANLESGIVSSALFLKKKKSGNFGVFETDELWVKQVLPKLKSKYLLLLDLFPDQVDRYGGIDNIQNSIIEALKMSPETTLIYNTDDPNCQYVASKCKNKTIPFGINEKVSKLEENEKHQCPICNTNLTYSLHQYAQLGTYKCQKCGFKSQDDKFSLQNIKLDTNSLSFKYDSKTITSKKAAEYVAYNLSGFIACVKVLGVSFDVIKKAIETQKNNNARMQYFNIKNKKIMINLAKNPVGFNQNINYVIDRVNLDKNKEFALAFFVNAREGDGRSTQWLSDVNFKALVEYKNIKVFYGGEAGAELLNALNNNGITAIKVEKAKDVILKSEDIYNLFIIANYTAVFPLQDELVKISKEN